MRKILLASTVLASLAAHAQPIVKAPAVSVITPGHGTIIDPDGNSWSISESGSVREGDAWTSGGGGTSALAIIGGQVFGQDAKTGQWFALNSGSFWTATATPPGIAAAPAQPLSSAPAVPQAAPAAAPAAPLPAAPPASAICASLPAVQTLLPCGPLHTSGSQVVDQQNRPVRLNCTAWWGDAPNWDASMLTLITAGFNCVRVSYYNVSIDQDLAMIDDTVTAAAKVSVRVIINNHANEGDGDCGSQQKNGMWFDQGPGSNGTDGCGASGTVTDAKWVSDWVKVATRYSGNNTVIGYDLWNEPLEIQGGSTWGGGGPTDIRAAYMRAGNAIQAVDSGPLIIAEGPIRWAPLYQEDNTGVRANPVTLTVPNKVVYSAHLYPKSIGGQPVDNGNAYIQQMNAAFGFLVTENIAPVWIGEIGSSMNTPADQQWAATVVPYLNGKAPGGIVIPPGGQGVSTDWWMWSCLDGGQPDGALQGDRMTPKPAQAAVYSQFVQAPLTGSAAATTAAFGAQVTILSAASLPTQTVQPTAPTSTATPEGTAESPPVTLAPIVMAPGAIADVSAPAAIIMAPVR